MAIHTNINVIFGTNVEHTKRFMDILAPEGYDITMSESGDIPQDNGSVRMVILCRTGFELIENIRSRSDVPIMYISERSDEFNTIMALSKGADSVVSENVGEMEFAARVKAILRRSSTVRNERIVEENATLSAGSIRLDSAARTVTVDGREVRTTKLEFGIMEYLMRRRGTVCSADEIYSQVWNSKSYDVKKTVVEHIRRLRGKIEADPKNPRYIKVVFGAGYIFTDIAAADSKTA